MVICIYGGASKTAGPEYLEAAYQTGLAIGRAHADLLYGGGRFGSMGACAKGAREAGSRLISVIPDFLQQYQPAGMEDDRVIVTQTMSERKTIMERESDAFIILPGGIGTLDEFFEVLVLKELERIRKPIVILNSEGFYDPLISMLHEYVERRFVNPAIPGLFKVAGTPEEAVRLAAE